MREEQHVPTQRSFFLYIANMRAVTAKPPKMFTLASATAISPSHLDVGEPPAAAAISAPTMMTEEIALVTAIKGVCKECSDDRKDKPLLGLEIIRGAKKAEGKDVWEGGKILDPENGRNYTLRMTPVEGGKKLEVRGSIGPFGRTQTWVRVQ